MKLNESALNIFSDDEAQGLVEYSLIVSLIALAVLVSLGIFGGALLDFYRNEILKKVEEF